MEIINELQGSEGWLRERAACYTASEAAAMMNATNHTKRDELLHVKKFGTDEEINAWVQKNLFDKGHDIEKATRPHIEKMQGEDLFPVTGKIEIEGMSLLSSYDGINMMESIVWECKSWNDDLVASVRNNDLPPKYYWQLEQQLLVSGAEKVIFTVSDGESRYESCIYKPVTGRSEELIAGWKQFAKDLAEFVPANDPAQVIGKSVDNLPVLQVNVTGSVISTNVDAFKQSAEQFLSSINKDLQSDEDFADAENVIKACTAAELQIKSVEELTIGQMADVSQVIRAVKAVGEQVRQARLDLEKLVKNKKTEIRQSLISEAELKFSEHLTALTGEFDFNVTIPHTANFVGAIKGKRTLESLRNEINSELARVKIEVDGIAQKMRQNVKFINDLEDDYWFLFHDIGFVCVKDQDDFALLVDSRVNSHKEALAEKARQEEAEKLLKQQSEAYMVATEQNEAPNPVRKVESVPILPETHAVDPHCTNEELIIYWVTHMLDVMKTVPQIDSGTLAKFVDVREKRIISTLNEILKKVEI